MQVHFIAIGGSAMHNLAIALHRKGYAVTGSDDEIFEPSRSRLASHGILPDALGWDAGRIKPGLDAVILGMHAKADNPELLRARELGLKIFSYPEYLYEQSKQKKRVVIGGSHGKTTITAMILHVLREAGMDSDYMVGAQLEGFDVMVKLTEEAPVMVIEGDEYLTSPIDLRPKFHLYMPDIALLSGIAWDHINVFPTFENYISQFETFIRLITPGGTLVWCSEDPDLRTICESPRNDIRLLPYATPPFTITNGVTSLLHDDGTSTAIRVFGRHNLANLEGARLVCRELGITDQVFYCAIASFGGASKRLEKIAGNGERTVYKDFAHAPSKVQATLRAVREQYPGSHVTACLELHTYSSLNEQFMPHYAGTLDGADRALVYFNPHALQIKRLPDISPEQVAAGFAKEGLEVCTDSKELARKIMQERHPREVLLMMSSGNYDGIDLKAFATDWVNAPVG